MNIAIVELEEWQKKSLLGSLESHKLQLYSGTLSTGRMEEIRQCEALGVFIFSRVTKEVIDRLPMLKLVVTMSTGFDHIDTAYCRQKGIVVCNVPTYGENTVAEHSFALLLALSRKIYPSIKRTHEQQSFETDASLRGFDLKGKTIGVIGCGNIGKHMVRMAVGFEMSVLVVDHHPDEAIASLPNVKYVDMDTMLSSSDIITLAVPYNRGTHHLIGAESIGKMRNGVFIINTSRGGVIDTHALVRGLETKKIAGAGLDVLEGECEVKEEMSVLKEEFKATCDLRTILANHLLMKMDNVIITPHNAFNSTEALQRILHVTVGNIEAFCSGKPVNKVGGT